MGHVLGNTGVMFHAKHVDTKGPDNIVIRGNDTATFIVLLVNIQKLLQSHLWFDTGFDFDNSHNYVDVSKLFTELDYVEALPRIYSYAGVDYLATFYSKGKSSI